MREMLDLAKRNIRSAVDRMMHFANQKRTPRTFEVGDQVYLLVSPRIGSAIKSPKLSPRYCGPWKIIKKIGKVAYKLELPMGSRIHPVFHVSRLKKCLLNGENVVDGIVALQSPVGQDYGPDRILDSREKKLRNRSFRQVLVSWKGHPITDATWESVRKFRKAFPDFIIEDDDQLFKGDGMSCLI
jgi:ribosomal protein L21E